MKPPAAAEPPTRPDSGLGMVTGALLIVANMIGVGVFITTGYMLQAIPSPRAVLAAWLCGGAAALCGALTYAELGAAFPRNGGEYLLLSRIFHPAIGFVAGWISLIVGFSAPLALYAMTFGTYLQAVVPRVSPIPAGLCLIVLFAVLHSLHVQTGSRLHNAFTLGKGGVILLFILAGLARGDALHLSADSPSQFLKAVLSPAFAVQLVYVSFAYAGWNTAGYLAGEFRNPQRDIPGAVVVGVSAVIVLYLGLNAVFLSAAPLGELAGQPRIGHVAAARLFGPEGGRFVSLLIVAGLVSTVSANLMSGPRVYEAMGADHPRLRLLARRRAGGGPVAAIALQSALAALMLVTSSFDALLTYIGVTLSLCAAATVVGAMVLRRCEPGLRRPFRIPWYPLPPLVFLTLEGWMIAFTVWDKPWSAAAGAATVAAGFAVYRLTGNRAAQASAGACR